MKKIILMLMLLMLVAIPVYAEDNVRIGVSPEEGASECAWSDEDVYALKCVIFWEGVRADCGKRNGTYYMADPTVYHTCPFELYLGIGETVLNRVASSEYPNTIARVCKQKGAFVCKNLPSIAPEVVETLDDVVAELYSAPHQVLPADYVFFATKKQSCAKDHIRIGDYKGHRLYFGRKK